MPVRFLTLILTLLLVACSSQEDQEEPKITTEQEFYNTAQRQLRASSWELAIENLQALEANFPFGSYAEQAQLELIYAYYRNHDFEAATSAADRFIRLHPQHRNVDYAYYMKGLASFTEGRGMFERFLETDLTQRDPGTARQSFAHFSQLLSRFPTSEYAPDARKRMIYLRNLLARYEIHVANYYFKRGAYVAAGNRGRYVVENFQQTPAVPDALAVMVQSYHLLGLPELGESALATLRLNFPDHPALNSRGEFDFQLSTIQGERSLLAKSTFGLFDKKEPRGFDSRAIYNPEYRANGDPAPQRAEEEDEKTWLDLLKFW